MANRSASGAKVGAGEGIRTLDPDLGKVVDGQFPAMLPLNASAFVILNGNGLTVSEDLARRFVQIDFDPQTEDPEARAFKSDIRTEVIGRRKDCWPRC